MRALDMRRAAPPTQQRQGPVRRHTPDYLLLIITLALVAIGVVVVYSISPALAVGRDIDGSTFVARQLIAVGLGLSLFFIASRVPMSMWRRMCIPLLVLAAVATLVTLILPVNADYPAHRWIRVGGLSFQSVELLKFALILWVAGLLVYRTGKDQLGNFKATLQPLLLLLVGAGIIVAWLQSDLGSAVVIAAIIGGMAFIAGLPMKQLALVCLIAVVGGLLMIAASDYRRDRVSSFLHPTTDCATSADGYQACQALIAVGSGGIAGLGLGNSVQAYGYLPEAANDSIFAIYAEKFGFIGVAVLLGLLTALYARIKRVADGAPDQFSRLVVMGILIWLSTQAIMNIGAMIGLIPLKGITLPLISYGGSSVFMVLLVLGVVFNVSRYTSYSAMRNTNMRKGLDDDNRDRRRIRGTYHPPFSSRR